MVQVILLDFDYLYCSNVSKAITGKSKLLNCVDWKTYMMERTGIIDKNDTDADSDFLRPTDLSTLSIAWDTTMVIYHPQYFYNAPEKAFQMVLTENDNTNVGGVPTIYKYSSITEIISILEQYINDNPDLKANSTSKGLICVAGDACPALRRISVSNLVRNKLEQGFKIVEIDFCPPFMSDFITPAASGYTLSDALLRVIADDLSHEDIGLFLIPDNDGIFHFRCVERTDDLYECSPTHIRKFIETVIKWVKHTNFTYYLVINCSGVPFSFIYTISVMCDTLMIVNNSSNSQGSIAYNKELSYLLANLPGSCKVLNEYFSCSDRKENDAVYAS